MRKQFVITLKRSPIVMLKNFIFMELGGYAAFLLLGAIADYGKIYGELNFSRVLSYHFAELTFVVFSEIAIAIFIFFEWFFGYYQITSDGILHARGVFIRKKTIIPLEHIDQVTHEYGVLGKILKYGTLVVRESTSHKTLRFPYVTSPQKYAGLMMKLKKTNYDSVSDRRKDLSSAANVEDLIKKEENEYLEFKSTLRWDTHAAKVNRLLEKTVMKTVAAFLNSGGGHLVIGVDDRRNLLGLESDYKTLSRPDADAFESHFTNVFNSAIGAEFRQFVKLHFKKVNDKDICVVEVAPGTKPAYLRFDGDEEFYVRTGNTTTPLKVSELASYLDLWRRRTD